MLDLLGLESCTPEQVQAIESILRADPRERRMLGRALTVLSTSRSLAAFFRLFWGVIEPSRPLVWNWHLDLLCDAIQRQVEGDPKYRRLLIMMPPGQMKSVLASVMRPAWIWLTHPERRSLYVSSNDDLPVRDSRRTRDIIEHRAYQQHIQILAQLGGPKPWTLKDDQNEKVNFENTHTGFRQCVSLYGRFTGKRGDDVALDDVLDAGEVVKWSPEQIAARVELANTIIANQLQSRVNDPKTATWLLVMQGLNGSDPAQVAIRDGDWEVISLPMEFDPTHPYKHPQDPRTIPGQLLNEGFNSREEVDRLKRKMKPVHYAWQYQQFGREAEGGEYAQHVEVAPTYAEPPDVRALRCAHIDITVDPTGKGKSTSDDAGIQAWGRDRSDGVLLDLVPRRPMAPEECEIEIVQMARKWPTYRHIYVEDTAQGPAIIERLRKRGMRGVIAVSPGNRSKGARVEMGSGPALRARNILLPKEEHVPAVKEWKHEHMVFVDGRSKRDAHVDATSQVWIQWSKQDADPVWLSEGVVDLMRSYTRDTPLWTTASAPMVQVSGWFEAPVRSPQERYYAGVVPSWGHAGGAPSVAVVVADGGEVVATVRVDAGGRDALAEALLSVAHMLESKTLPGTGEYPTIRARFADPPKESGLSEHTIGLLRGHGRLVRVVPESDGALVWVDTSDGQARAQVLSSLSVGIEGMRTVLLDGDWVDALGAVVVDHDTGRMRSGRGTPDPRYVPPRGEMDVRVLALALAEDLRQRMSGASSGLRVVGGAKAPHSEFQRYTTGSSVSPRANDHSGMVRRMFGL